MPTLLDRPFNVLLLDNADSFTLNICESVYAVIGQRPVILSSTAITWPQLGRSIDAFDAILISAGPGRPDVPQDIGCCLDVIRESPIPLFGICLGEQGISIAFGGSVVRTAKCVHGIRKKIMKWSSELFRDVPKVFEAVCYNSLVVDSYTLPNCLEVIAQSFDEPHEIMALQHVSRPIFGVQFHPGTIIFIGYIYIASLKIEPESIQSDYGLQIFSNFFNLARKVKQQSIARSIIDMDSNIFKQSKSFMMHRNDSFESSNTRLSIEVESRTLSYVDPEIIFQNMQASDRICWLDSSLIVNGRSKYSYIALPSNLLFHKLTYTMETKTVHMAMKSENDRFITLENDMSFFDFVHQQLEMGYIIEKQDDVSRNLEFIGGYVGLLNYEMKAECPGMRNENKFNSQSHDAIFYFFDRVIVFDHIYMTMHLVALYSSNNRSIQNEWMTTYGQWLNNLSTDKHDSTNSIFKSQTIDLTLRDNEETYRKNVSQCLEWIGAGECYEMCLTTEHVCELTIESELSFIQLYLSLRHHNPAPYSAYFASLPELCLLSSSPERLAKISSTNDGETYPLTRIVECKPIKGTRRRGKSPIEDELLAFELAQSMKDRAENLMIVDLIRHDLARISRPGSVEVRQFACVETYATVHQLVSSITCQLRDDLSSVQCLRSVFPPGSMTGAPKRRSVDLLETIESGARGAYSGSLGYFSLNGFSDWNVVIRSIVLTKSKVDDKHSFRASVGAGGAITSLSTPDEEFDEMMLKAKTPIYALSSAYDR